MRNLHDVDVESLGRGEIDNLREEGLASTMAPIDLLSMLNGPFSSLKGLQVPSLTNALVAVCADVVVLYAKLLREYVQGMGTVTVRPPTGVPAPAASVDGMISAAGVCAAVNNAERMVELLEKLADHIDEGVEEEEGAEEDTSETDMLRALPVGDDRAREAMLAAEAELGTIGSSGVHLLATLVIYRPCGNVAQAPLVMRELLPVEPSTTLLATLRGVLSALRWAASKVSENWRTALELAVLQLLVGLAIEAMFTPKYAAVLRDPAANDGSSEAGRSTLTALSEFGSALAYLDERRVEHHLSPLLKLFELSGADLSAFPAKFAALRASHAEVGAPVADFLLSRRALAKDKVKELVTACVPNKDAEGLSHVQVRNAGDAWAPVEVAPLAGTPFGLANARLMSTGSGWLKMRGLIPKKK